MKGVVFNAFFDHVEKEFGLATLDDVISSCDLRTEGAYTAVGTYDVAELVAMLARLSETSGKSVAHLLRQFGRFLFNYLVEAYPDAVRHASNSFELVASVDQQIHVEVRKLYADADLPRFEHVMDGPDEMTLDYRSERRLGDLARGLLDGCFAYFGEKVDVEQDVLEDGGIRFCLHRITHRDE